jgi:hypothetical protein
MAKSKPSAQADSTCECRKRNLGETFLAEIDVDAAPRTRVC